MPSNRTVHVQIEVALHNLRDARLCNDIERMEVAEAHLNRLLDRLTHDMVAA